MPDPLCPVCRRPTPNPSPRLRPFCSPRCADVDLGRWFAGEYRVPVAAPDSPAADWESPIAERESDIDGSGMT